MQIQIRLAEPFWRPVGKRELNVEVAEGARIADLLSALGSEYPALSAEFAQTPPTIFIGEDEAEADSVLTENARIHFVWPIAGG